MGFLALVYEFPYGDKAGHFILYGILSFLVNLTFLQMFSSRPSKQVALIVSVILALLIGLEEFSQNFFSLRTPSWWDLASSYLGVTAGAWGAWMVRCVVGRRKSA